MKVKYNIEAQQYGGVILHLLPYAYDKFNWKAKRYRLNNTNQNIWIPNVYLEEDGTIKAGVNLGFIFNKKDT